MLSGVSSRFSRGNVKRGLKVAAISIAITIVTYLMDMQILFGILHLLAFCMIFFGLTRRLWDVIPRAAAPFLYIAALVGSALAVASISLESEYIWMFGWTQPGFRSFDYFPILPWVFVFLLGTWAGTFIREGRLPGWFYRVKPRLFPAIGTKALLIYILHQPVLYGLVMGISYVIT
jgi:uncharacterized membrane protein